MMTLDIEFFQPVAALVAGFLVLVLPRLLNAIVAVYLITTGMIGLFPHLTLSDPLAFLR